MNTATVINLSLIPLCTAVMVQGWRIDRRMRAFRNAPLTEGVASLERATAQARAVLGELKRVLATDGMAQARTIADAEAMRDELADMVGIGNAVADRILSASEQSAAKKTARKPAAKTVTAEGEEAAEKTTARRSTTRRAATRKAAPKTAKPKVAAAAVAKPQADAGVEAAIAAAVAEAKELSAEIVMHPSARAASRKRAAA